MKIHCGHKSRKHLAKGLCSPCYYRQYNANPKNRKTYKNRQEAFRRSPEYKIWLRTAAPRFSSLKCKAKSFGIDFKLTKAQWLTIIKDPCFYCKGYFPPSETGGGLDRIDNARGYILDNVVPCCTICNKTKNNYFTLEETSLMIKTVIELRRSKI